MRENSTSVLRGCVAPTCWALLLVLALTAWIASYVWSIGWGFHKHETRDGKWIDTEVGIGSSRGSLHLLRLNETPTDDGQRAPPSTRQSWVFEVNRAHPYTPSQVAQGYSQTLSTAFHVSIGGLVVARFSGWIDTATHVRPPPRGPRGNSVRVLIIGIPYWLVTLLLALPMVRAWYRLPPPKNLRCINCGYDLRGSKDRCPECGTPIPSAESQETSGHV